jgi:hypothetical protein
VGLQRDPDVVGLTARQIGVREQGTPKLPGLAAPLRMRNNTGQRETRRGNAFLRVSL